MNRRSGQAAHVVAVGLRWLGAAVLAVLLVLALGLAALVIRLDQGPLPIPYVASRLATAVSGGGVTVHVDQAALAWAGYKRGGGVPLYLRLRGITASNAGGVALATVPEARLLFPPRMLLGAGGPVDVAGKGARLAQADSDVGVAGLFRFGFGFALRRADVTVTLGPGTLGPPGERLAITGGGFVLRLAGADAALQSGRLVLRPVGGSAPVVGFSGTAHRAADWRAVLVVTADAAQAADLAAYWPPAVGSGARGWVTKNITGGTARKARFTLGLTAPGDLSGVELTTVTGGFDGDDLTLRWLPAARPITGLEGHLAVLDADTILITESDARLGGLKVSQGSMKITGVSRQDQLAALRLVLAGSVPDAVAVLNAPPLALLARAPAGVLAATGQVSVNVVATLPLQNKLKLSQVALAVDARLSGLTVPTPVAGLAFTQGTLALKVSETQLSAAGAALLAGEKSTISALMEFGAAPALRRLTLRTVLGPAALDGFGLDAETEATDAVRGSVPVAVDIGVGTGGGNTATADADLTGAKLGVPVLGWAKGVGQPGQVHAAAVIDAGGLLTVQSVAASGPALDIQGRLRDHVLHLAPLVIGRTDATGDVTFPQAAGTPWLVDLRGTTLDVRAILNRQHGAEAASAARQPPPGAEAPSGPPWQARLRFAALYLGKPPAPALRGLTLTGSGMGAEVLALNAAAQSGGGQPLSVVIGPAPAAGRRALELRSGDGGGLLRVLGAYDDVQGGALEVAAVYGGGAPFAGTVTLNRFQLLQAPAIGKILQGLTIYGVAEAAAGPGLVFSRLIAPFSIAHQTLTLDDARAYSASLGFTASGTIGLADGAADLNATVIPAYALNALPGKIPVIGKLFTAEKGGGLFAVRVKVTGQLAAPRLRVNPLSALTPGALRGVFGGREAK